MLVGYFKKVGIKRLLIMVRGNIFLGMGVSIFKFSGMGNDSYSGMVMALAECVNIEYANFLILVNIVIFILEFIFGREYIGAGTVVNACFLGYFATFFYNIWLALFSIPQNLVIRIIIVFIGVIFTGLGVSLYQTPNVGTSPYDSLSLIMAKRMPKISYRWHRIFTDAVCALICFLAGGIVGLGTLVASFGLGPVIEFFNIHVSRKLFRKDEDII